MSCVTHDGSFVWMIYSATSVGGLHFRMLIGGMSVTQFIGVVHMVSLNEKIAFRLDQQVQDFRKMAPHVFSSSHLAASHLRLLGISFSSGNNLKLKK